MEAYAKLVDRNSLENDKETQTREFLITDLPCSLGRVNLPPDQSFSIVIDEDDVILSRQHAKLQWLQDTEWSLVCLSKNGFLVDDVKYKKDEQATLNDGSNIRLGKAIGFLTSFHLFQGIFFINSFLNVSLQVIPTLFLFCQLYRQK